MKQFTYIMSKNAFDSFLVSRFSSKLEWTWTDFWYQGKLMYRVVTEEAL